MRHAPALSFPRLSRPMILRGVAAGMVWGLLLSGGLLGLSLYQCGGLCVADVVETTSLSLLAGVIGIGPVAAFPRND